MARGGEVVELGSVMSADCGIRSAECKMAKFRRLRAPCESMIFEKARVGSQEGQSRLRYAWLSEGAPGVKGHKGTEEDRKGQLFFAVFFLGVSLVPAVRHNEMTEITVKHTKTHKCTYFLRLFFLL